jgi:outer membrane protein, heavy metal efflux system
LLPVIVFQEPAPPLTLEIAVAETLRSHPRITGLRRELLARLQAVKGARALAAPSITVSPGITSFSGTTEELLALQPLEVNGTRSARVAVALADFHLAQADAEESLLQLTYDVHFALLTLDQARARQALTESQRTDAQTLERLAKKQVELGTRPGIDLEQLALESLKAENAHTQAISRVKSAEQALNLLLGRPVESALPVLPALSLPKESSKEESDAILAAALTLRPEIKQAAAVREGLEAQQRLTHAEGKPDIAPMLRVGNLFRGTPAGSTGNGAGIGVSFTLPLDHGSRRARRAALQEQLEAQKSHRAEITRQIEREVRDAWGKLATAQAVLTRYETEMLPRVERLLRASRIGFEEGKTSVLAIIEAQRTQRQLQSEALQARADVFFAHAALDRARGISLIPLPEVSL